jgi:biotin-dependent carboxylase-like uncharacterized protein
VNIEVLKPGLMTTLQDRGRFGCAMLGVGRAGAMDDVAMRLANALVGNAPDAPALEITLAGPRVRFEAAATLALTGGEFPARIGERDVAMWRPVEVDAGAVLDIGAARRGARAYLAVAGGFIVEPTLGSVSTDVNARLGGLDGRPLCEGDTLVVGVDPSPDLSGALRSVDLRGTTLARRKRNVHSSGFHQTWSLDPRPWFDPDASHPIRLVRGSHFDALDAASRAALFGAAFRIDKDSNRVGFRLDGPRLALSQPLELVSEPLAIGTLQLPPGGAPIALMAEHPTVGGYPRIGQIAAIDLPRLAQRRPGDVVRFVEIDLDAAQTRYLERERELERLIAAIGERLTR